MYSEEAEGYGLILAERKVWTIKMTMGNYFCLNVLTQIHIIKTHIHIRSIGRVSTR